MIVAIDQESIPHPKLTNQNVQGVTTRLDAKTGVRRESPYRAKNLDGAITHLELAVSADGNIAVFGRRYWLDRVQRIASTPQIMPAQARRLQHLLDRLEKV